MPGESGYCVSMPEGTHYRTRACAGKVGHTHLLRVDWLREKVERMRPAAVLLNSRRGMDDADRARDCVVDEVLALIDEAAGGG